MFIKKISGIANVNVTANFTQYFVRNCSQLVILRHVRTVD